MINNILGLMGAAGVAAYIGLTFLANRVARLEERIKKLESEGT